MISSDLNEVRELMEAGHWKQARAIIKPLYENDPNCPQLQTEWSMIMEAFGNPVEALRLADRAAAQAPYESACWLQLAQSAVTAIEKTSPVSHMALIRKSRAARERAIALEPRDPKILMGMAMFLAALPKEVGGDREESLRYLTVLRTIAPARAVIVDALLYEHMAVSILKKASIQFPHDFDIATTLCGALENMECDAEVEKEARRVLLLDDSRVEGHGYLASSLAWQKRWQNLEDALAQSDVAQPDDRSPWYSAAAAIYSKDAENRRAIRYIEHYLDQEPEGRAPTVEDARLLLKKLRKSESDTSLRSVIDY